jgi:hypothetical protein
MIGRCEGCEAEATHAVVFRDDTCFLVCLACARLAPPSVVRVTLAGAQW